MNNISFNLSGKIEQKIVEAILTVKSITDGLDLQFFIVGATARDIILEHCYNIKAPRMTMDVDIGVEVNGWDKFEQLTGLLTNTNKFSRTNVSQRFLFDSHPIDIVPFGPIADENMRISWPPEHAVTLSTVGFDEAFKYSLTVQLSSNPELYIKLPSLPGLAILKIIAWNGRKFYKDAEDLLFIIRKYEDAGNHERIWKQESDLLVEEKFDMDRTAARLLGRDMASIANPHTQSVLRGILEKETHNKSQYRLVSDMIRNKQKYNDNFDTILSIVEKLKQGFNESSTETSKI